MKDLRYLKDLTIHDVQPISDELTAGWSVHKRSGCRTVFNKAPKCSGCGSNPSVHGGPARGRKGKRERKKNDEQGVEE